MPTIMHLIFKIWTALLVLNSLSPEPALCEDAAEVLFEHGESGENDQQEPNNTYYKDITHFQGGLNAWDFMGMWSKYDLLSLEEDMRPIPINPLRPDQAVFICHTSALPSVMVKTFPPLEKVNLTIGYYLSSMDMDLIMSGTVEVGEKTEEIFNYSSPMDTHELNDSWVTQHFHLSAITKEGDFKLKFILRSLSANKTKILRDIWATDEVVVEGFKVTSLPIVGTEQPEPESNATSPNPDTNSTEPAIQTNVTTGTNETNVGTTVASNVTVGTNETSVGTNVTVNQNETSNVTDSGVNGNATTEEPEGQGPIGPSSFMDNISKLASVADAIWNAFYVFLALFCACLIALVGLIVRGRCKDNDNPPPSVATYNPRTASYRLDKVYDNAGYDTNAV